MPSRNEPSFEGQNIEWVDVVEEHLGKRGEVGVLSDLVVGNARYLDGYSFAWCAMAQRFRVGDLAGALEDQGSTRELAELRERYPDEDELVQVPTPTFALLLSFPDWPSEDAVTYVLPLHDADDLLKQMQDTIRVARKNQGRFTSTILREARARHQDDTRTRCAYEGCKKQRSFFDEEGNGFCKKHAEEIGLRPKGKVT